MTQRLSLVVGPRAMGGSYENSLSREAEGVAFGICPRFIGGNPRLHFVQWTRVWPFAAPKNAVDPHPSLRATLSHQERENNKGGVWLRSTFHAMPLPLCHATSVCYPSSQLSRAWTSPSPLGRGWPQAG